MYALAFPPAQRGRIRRSVEDYSPAAWVQALPILLAGTYESSVQWRLLAGLLGTTVVLWVVGAVHFGRKDV